MLLKLRSTYALSPILSTLFLYIHKLQNHTHTHIYIYIYIYIYINKKRERESVCVCKWTESYQDDFISAMNFFFDKWDQSRAKSAYVLYSHLHIYAASQRHNIIDRRMKEGRHMNEDTRLRRRKTSLTIFLPLSLLQGFERLFMV